MKRRFSLPLLLGIALILCALGFLLFSQIQMQLGAQHSQQAAAMLQEILPGRTPGTPGLYPDAPMPVLEIDAVDYVALVEIPAFGITLPVANRWDSSRLADSPARFYGSAYDHTLIIGGADHSQQFGFCSQINHGALVTVTDMTGSEFTYSVSRIDRAPHAESQWLLDEDFDLTLFCHDPYAMEYIAVRCVFVYR